VAGTVVATVESHIDSYSIDNKLEVFSILKTFLKLFVLGLLGLVLVSEKF